MSLNYVLTQGGITLILNGKPVTVAKSDKAFQDVLQAVREKKDEQSILEILESERIKLEQASQVTPDIAVRGGMVYYKNEPVGGVLGERMLQMVDEGFDLLPMARFLENLQKNPSKRVVDHLYAFLEHGKNPITEDGCFLAYKAVRDNYLDIHSGTFDNSVGQVVEMPRNRVDEDPDQTCSAGLHVCSFEYLPYFSHADGHVMVCKVNPADVVAVPRDYNNTKMRVCKYEVVGEYSGYYSEERKDTLANTSVANGAEEGTFRLEADYGDGEGYSEESSFDRLLTAVSSMESLLENTDIRSVRLVNTRTGVVLDERENENFEEDSSEPEFFEDDFEEDDDTFRLYGREGSTGEFVLIDSGFDSVNDAVMAALEDGREAYTQFEVRDQNDETVRTIS